MSRWLLAMVVVWVGMSSVVWAELNVHNRTNFTIDVAHGENYMVGGVEGDMWVKSTGWYTLKPGEQVTVSETGRGDHIIYARAPKFKYEWRGRDTSEQGRETLCVKWKEAFPEEKFPRYNLIKGCQQKNGMMVVGRRHTSNDDVSNYNITGGPSVLRVCNKTSIPQIKVAHATYQNNTWITQGWTFVNAGEDKCGFINLGEYKGDAFVHAEGGGKGWGGNSIFCVSDDNKFQLSNADTLPCNGPNQVKEGFAKVTARPGIVTVPFNP